MRRHPPDPSPSASEHAIEPMYEEPSGIDIDGVGVDEAERIDGEPLLAVREVFRCPRDGCEASLRRVHLYRLDDVDRPAVADAYGPGITNADPVEFLATRATIVDHDGEHPYIGFETDGEPADYVRPCDTIESGSVDGPCYGHVEPNPDIDSYRYEEL